MLNNKFHPLGTAPSFIRGFFMYALEQTKIVEPENVFDFSIGNPNIPTPEKINKTICDETMNSYSVKLHGYSVAAGFDTARKAVADNLNRDSV